MKKFLLKSGLSKRESYFTLLESVVLKVCFSLQESGPGSCVEFAPSVASLEIKPVDVIHLGRQRLRGDAVEVHEADIPLLLQSIQRLVDQLAALSD